MLRAAKQLWQSGFWRRDEHLESAWEVVGWWETRRVAYNLIVGSVGIVTCIVAGVIAAASYFLFDSEFGMPDPPLFAMFGIVLYAAFANICYTGGWLAELVVRAAWPRQANRFATLAMSAGLVFSVLVTLAPAIVLLAGGTFALIGHYFGVAHGTPTPD